MTKQILTLNIPNKYDLLTDEEVDIILESLISQEKFQPLDLQFLKKVSLLKKENSESSNMLKHYVTSYDKKLIENIFCQARNNGEKELVANMLEIEPKLKDFVPVLERTNPP